MAANQEITAGQAAAPGMSGRLRDALHRVFLISPAMAIIIGIMLIPLGLMLVYSFLSRARYGGVIWDFSTDAYVSFLFERALDDSLVFYDSNLRIFARSFGLSFLTMVLALLLGFPAAMFIAMQAPKYRAILVFLVTIPFWTNLLVRNYAWLMLLRDRGLINNTLINLGVTSEPLSLMYNNFGITLGLVYSFLPFMVLPIYASIEKMDWRLVEAAHDLGADRLRALKRVIIPLAKPGIIAGCVLVFVPSLGAYITPALLGGGRKLMIGNLIQLQFGPYMNWPFGSALAFILLAIVLLALVVWIMWARRADRGGLKETGIGG